MAVLCIVVTLVMAAHCVAVAFRAQRSFSFFIFTLLNKKNENIFHAGTCHY
uniref:Uncharacterized protein n=1 Tax=Anguilla anguilla TaxID=7936 RepID=A0A0E9RMS6_ANGAN